MHGRQFGSSAQRGVFCRDQSWAQTYSPWAIVIISISQIFLKKKLHLSNQSKHAATNVSLLPNCNLLSDSICNCNLFLGKISHAAKEKMFYSFTQNSEKWDITKDELSGVLLIRRSRHTNLSWRGLQTRFGCMITPLTPTRRSGLNYWLVSSEKLLMVWWVSWTGRSQNIV